MANRVLDIFARGKHIPLHGGQIREAARFPDGREAVAVSGMIMAADLALDWRGYSSLRLEIYNPWGKPAIGGLEICDKAAAENGLRELGDSYNLHRAFLLGEGVTHVVIDISTIMNNRGDRALDASDIQQVVLFMPEAHGDAEFFAVSPLRLSESTEDIDEPEHARPGDAIIRIKRLDIKSYTYRPEDFAAPPQLLALEERVLAERAALADAIRYAEINGLQTHYEHASLVAADVALAR